ncbi:MAG: restriction endonuclease [Candidatus Eremiobacteraeota bacterium]|nr:restriction endonuclease [Candidatus Eremiobacteraeota bacterium]MBC5826997.1 restriction endonuclease [Candidatus Eremiobacteraeota bacterium]
MNALYYGDNLQVLRESIADESVDLIYLDPPFNSKRDYNVLFQSPKGEESDAQIVAFEDSWHWGEKAEREFSEIRKCANTDAAEMMQALRSFLGDNDMLAYLTMMANRLLELHRVLKLTGSLYLHCDPTASHYLKIVLDAVFGHENFRSEIIWRRSAAHNSARRYGPIHDTIFFYSKTESFKWNRVFNTYTRAYVESFFNNVDDKGRYRTQTLTGSGTRNGESGQPWRVYDPTSKGRHWAFPGPIAEELGIQGLTVHQKLDYLADNSLIMESNWLPEYRQYLHQSPGVLLQDIWAYQPFTNGVLFGTDLPIDDDIRWVGDRNDPDKLGYPTQKPRGILERMIRASSDCGDVVLDPFCGCGTAVHAAQSLGREWIGIDITHLAISLIERRLRGAFPSIQFAVFGTPTDLDGARDLALRDKYQFQWWACFLVNCRPYQGKKKGADTGIDGLDFFEDEKGKAKRVIVSVKGGENVGVTMVKDLIATVQREKAAVGLFVTLAPPTRPMKTEAASAGFYESPIGGSYPRIQILTIEGLMNGSERPQYPLSQSGGLAFKRTKVEVRNTEQGTLFGK